MYCLRIFPIVFVVIVITGGVRADAAQPGKPLLEIHRFLPEKPLSRALRPAPVSAVIENPSNEAVQVTPELILPEGVRLLEAPEVANMLIPPVDYHTFIWKIEASEAGAVELRLKAGAAAATLRMRFLPPLEMKQLDYIPEPVPAASELLVGAHHCPLWEADRPEMWSQLIKHPEAYASAGILRAGESGSGGLGNEMGRRAWH